MSYSDGRKLVVFGLSFAQQDTHRMQQVLGHYQRLPDTTSRAILFAELSNLARELMSDEARQGEIQTITDWMQDGDPFSEFGADTPSTPFTPTPSGSSHDAHTTVQQPASEHMLHPSYRLRYGGGRTVDGLTEDAAANGVEFDFMEMANPDRLTPWIIREIDHALRFIWEDSDEDSAEEAGALHANRRRGNRNQDVSITTNALPESVENEMANPNDIYNEGSGLVEVFSTGADPFADMIMECPICGEEYPRDNFPSRPSITGACDHPEMACLACLDASIATIIERGALHLLACPICPANLTSKDVKEYASRQVYERYKHLKKQSEMPGYYIPCMNPPCGGSQPHDSEDPRLICRYCNFATCAHHKRPWHEGQTCIEFDLDDAQMERLEEEEATANLLSIEGFSICPKCGQGVTKSDGCDRMNCTCGEEWCYICSCPYENVILLGSTAHATFCIYHPNKVDITKDQREAARNRILGLVHGGEISAELTKARDELRERRRVAMRPKVAEAAEARRKAAKRQQEESNDTAGGSTPNKKQKVTLVAPWEEDGWEKKSS